MTRFRRSIIFLINIKVRNYDAPADSRGATFLLTAEGTGGDGVFGTADDQLATDSFTDNVSVKLDQWSNGPAPDADGTGNLDEQWVNGNLGSGNAHYTEGQSVPYRAIFDDLEPGKTYALTIEWDTLASGKYAIDFLTGYDFSVAAPEPHPVPTLGVSGMTSGDVTLVDITADAQLLTGFNSGLTNGLNSGQPKGGLVVALDGAVARAAVHGGAVDVRRGEVFVGRFSILSVSEEGTVLRLEAGAAGDV